ncbi:MAG: DUF2974 domain-containing protein, partial [Thiotrichaceae bacterium]|nr:DUF2974 domain-containing protein [Thiotrichaceae bacterium]
MIPHKLIVQEHYGWRYRLHFRYEAPIPAAITPQPLSNEYTAWAFIARLEMNHADWLAILHMLGKTSANSALSLYDSQQDIARLVCGSFPLITFYPLRQQIDFSGQRDHFPVINATQGLAYHFVPASILLLSDPDPADVRCYQRNEWQQAQAFLEGLALTDEQLATIIPGLQLWGGGSSRAERFQRLLKAFVMGDIAVVRVRERITPAKRSGPEDLPVEYDSPQRATLGPHEEPGYVPPPPPVKSDTEKRQENYVERQQLAGNANDTPAQQAAAARLLDNNDNILRAESAAYVYSVDEFNRGQIESLPDAPTGLNLINPSEIPGLENATFTDEETGFGAALFESEINGETMLTYRGTNNGVTGKQDWSTNFSQGLGRETTQYNQAMKLARKAKIGLGRNFVIVGHSLGGGLASAGTAVTGVKGYTYNAAGLHPKTAARKGGMSNEATGQLIQTRAVEGEVLTGAQRHGNQVLSGLGAGGGMAVAGLLGAGLGYLASKALPELPEAVGEMKSLPSVNGGNPVTRHGMDQV